MMDMKEALEAVRQDGIALKDVPEELKTEEVCLAAVRQNGYALAYVPEALKSPAVCIEALLENAWALAFVPEALRKRTPELEMLAGRRQLQQADEIYPPERNRYYMENSADGPVIRRRTDEEMEALRWEYEASLAASEKGKA